MSLSPSPRESSPPGSEPSCAGARGDGAASARSRSGTLRLDPASRTLTKDGADRARGPRVRPPPLAHGATRARSSARERSWTRSGTRTGSGRRRRSTCTSPGSVRRSRTTLRIPSYITTIRGVGFRFRAAEEALGGDTKVRTRLVLAFAYILVVVISRSASRSRSTSNSEPPRSSRTSPDPGAGDRRGRSAPRTSTTRNV